MTALIPKSSKVAAVRDLLEKLKPQIQMALPSFMTPERMTRVAMTSIQKNPTLLECAPESLAGAIIQSAQLGLEPDGVLGHAYLIPYGKQVTFIAGYKGLLQLARRSGEISTIFAKEVYEKDEFRYEYGMEPTVIHIPSSEKDRGEVKAFYAVAKLKDGGSQFEVMLKHEVDAIRAASPGKNSGAWVNHFAEMGKKTVLRRLCKYLPCSVELQKVVSFDEQAESGIMPQYDIEIPAEKEKPAAKEEPKAAELPPIEFGAAPDPEIEKKKQKMLKDLAAHEGKDVEDFLIK